MVNKKESSKIPSKKEVEDAMGKKDAKVHHALHNMNENGSDNIEISIDKIISKIRRNPWIPASIVLAIALIIVLIFMGSGSSTGAVSSSTVGNHVVSFINSNPQLTSQVTLSSVVQNGSLYKVIVMYKGREVPVYATLDGKYLIAGLVPLNGKIPQRVAQPKTTVVTATNKTV